MVLALLSVRHLISPTRRLEKTSHNLSPGPPSLSLRGKKILQPSMHAMMVDNLLLCLPFQRT
jgi:hypothetical protein